jgi:CitMHS family citrate-Mg2+:H+ or citrate-Ca2+:H+ symporter
VALILVPGVFAIIAQASGVATVPDGGVTGAIMNSIRDFAPTAALLVFAIIYFGLMIDVGLFDPLIRGILRVVGNSPVRLVVGTAVLASLVSFDGDGSTTFIITVSALLPVYLRLGLSPVVLTVVACMANGVMNIVPWGGPTIRAATVLNVPPDALFLPMLPSMAAALGVILLFAFQLGRMESRRLQVAGVSGGMLTPPARPGSGAEAGLDSQVPGLDEFTGLDPNRATLRPKLIWFNLVLTVVLLVLLVMNVLPLALLFMGASAIAILVNFPTSVADQSERIKVNGPAIVSVVALVFAAAVLVGVLDGTGMDAAMANAIVDLVPPGLGSWFAVITGLVSIPMTFIMGNDAFYFGVLPVLADAAGAYGITPVEMGRASIVGQPVHMTSPLVPATLLLISLASVDLADFHKKVIWRAAILALVMLAVAIAVGAVPA